MSTSQNFEPRASVLQFSHGNVAHESNLVEVVEPKSLFSVEARKGRLYLLLEPEGDSKHLDATAQLVMRTIRREFYADPTFSVTAGLRMALRAANKALYEANMSRNTRDRVLFGVSCVVVKDHELYIAQVSPAQAFVRANKQIRALPVPPAWNTAHTSATPFGPPRPLGTSLFVEPEFFRVNLGLGDAALIGSSRVATQFDRGSVERILKQATPDELHAALGAAVIQLSDPATHALVIMCLPRLSAAAQQAPLSPSGISERSKLAVQGFGDWLGGITGEIARSVRPSRRPPPPAPAPEVDPAAPAEREAIYSMPELSELPTNPTPRPRPIDLGEGLADRYEREMSERPEMPPSTFLGEDTHIPPTRGKRRVDLGDPMATATAKIYRPRFEARPLVDMTWGERLTLPFRQIAAAFEESQSQRRIRRREPPRPKIRVQGQGLSYRRQRSGVPWLLFTSLALVVTLLIFYGTTLSQQNADQRALEYLSIAEQRMVDVRSAEDETAALDRLDVARQAIEEVRASPNVTVTNTTLWLRYQDLEREYERALAAVQRLTFFEELTILATHPSPNGSFAAISVPPATTTFTDPVILENFSYLYALDAGGRNTQLYRVLRDGGTPELYLSPNQQVQTTLVGPLRAQTWRTDQVVALDAGTGGFGYYFRSGNNWSYTKLGDSEIWRAREKIDIETYDGNLYIWGAQPSEILKYNSGFYGDQPQFWVDKTSAETQDLSTVVDMAVDGNIYLLQPDGTVLVFSVGQLVAEIKPEAITPPITAVTGLFVTGLPQEGYIFLLDTLNERIVQLDKVSGKVIQQIKSRSDDPIRLNKLAAFWIDASGTRPVVYVANGEHILRSELPAPPRPFQRDSEEPTPTVTP